MPQEPQNWQTALEPGETLLWEGRLDPSFVFVWRHLIEALLAVSFAFGAVIVFAMMVLVPFSLLTLALLPGMIFFAGAAWLMGPFLHRRDARRRANTRYALTDRRAVIAEAERTGAVKLRSYPITANSPLGSRTGAQWSTVAFATERKRGPKGRFDAGIAFERLPLDTARHVYDHLVALKTAARQQGAQA